MGNLILENKEKYDNITESLQNLFVSVLENGEITEADKQDLDQLLEEKNYLENSLKDYKKEFEKLDTNEKFEYIKNNMISSNIDDILNILTNNGRKPWLYRDEEGNILMDGTAIPELTMLFQKLNLIATDGENESEIQLTPEFINLIAASSIVLTAKHINLNGYISNDGGNFSLDEQGRMKTQDLDVQGSISCEDLNVTGEINNAKYPKVLVSSISVSINESSGNDDIELKDGAVFQTWGGFVDACPKNLNGKTINVSFKTDITENVSISYFYCGRIRIYCEGHTIKGWVRKEYIPTLAQMYGGSIDNPTGAVGIIMPYVGLNQGSVSASFVNYGSYNTALNNMKVYAAKNLADGCTESVAVASGNNGYVYVSNVTPINCDYGFRTNSHGRLHSDSSAGKASKYGFAAVSGGYITLSNGTHTGGEVDNMYKNSGGDIIFKSPSFTIDGVIGTNDTTTIKTTKTVTYSSTGGNTWRTNYSSWRNDGTCLQGNAYGSGNCIGYLFFGNQFAELKGNTINKVVLKVKRHQCGVYGSSLSLKLMYHTYTSKPSTPSNHTYFKSVSIAAYSGDYVNITITDKVILDGIKAGTIKGFGLYDSNFASSSYGGVSGSAKVSITYVE